MCLLFLCLQQVMEKIIEKLSNTLKTRKSQTTSTIALSSLAGGGGAHDMISTLETYVKPNIFNISARN